MIRLKKLLDTNYYQDVDNNLQIYKIEIITNKDIVHIYEYHLLEIIPDLSFQQDKINTFTDEFIQSCYEECWLILFRKSNPKQRQYQQLSEILFKEKYEVIDGSSDYSRYREKIVPIDL